jgi:copper(I)-binding protein
MIALRRTSLTIAALAYLAATPSLGHGYKTGSLSIKHPWSRETSAGQSVGGGFMVVTNTSAKPDKLVSATTTVATEVQLHTMSMDGGIMRMRQVSGGIDVPSKGTLELKPGGYHLMFMGLKRPLKKDERFPVMLKFQNAGTLKVQFAVQAVGSTGPIEADHAMH